MLHVCRVILFEFPVLKNHLSSNKVLHFVSPLLLYHKVKKITIFLRKKFTYVVYSNQEAIFYAVKTNSGVKGLSKSK